MVSANARLPSPWQLLQFLKGCRRSQPQALGIQDMRRHNVLVRSLSAVEALGSRSDDLLGQNWDENRMSVVEIHTGMRHLQVSDGEFLRVGEENINPMTVMNS